MKILTHLHGVSMQVEPCFSFLAHSCEIIKTIGSLGTISRFLLLQNSIGDG